MKVKWDKSCWIVWQQKRIFDRQISGVCLGGGYVNEGCMSVLGCWRRHFRKLFLWSRRNLLDVTGAVDWPYPPFFFHSPCPSSFSHSFPPYSGAPLPLCESFLHLTFPPPLSSYCKVQLDKTGETPGRIREAKKKGLQHNQYSAAPLRQHIKF